MGLNHFIETEECDRQHLLMDPTPYKSGNKMPPSNIHPWLSYIPLICVMWTLPGMALYNDAIFLMGLVPDNAGNVFPATGGKRSQHASPHVRDARAVSFEVGGGRKRSRHSRRNPQFYVSGTRPMAGSLLQRYDGLTSFFLSYESP